MELKKKERELVERVVVALENGAKAQQDLLEIAKQEQFTIEQGPPVCPNCGKLNPTVTQLFREDASGPLSDFVMEVETHCCNRTVYCLATAWDVVMHVEIIEELLAMRKGGNHVSA